MLITAGEGVEFGKHGAVAQYAGELANEVVI